MEVNLELAMNKAGIVLCGGHSKRMGRPKAWLPFGDQTLLERVVERVGQAVASVVVVGARGQELPSLPIYIRVVHDDIPDQGPLGGLAAGLAAVAGDCDAVFVTSCDSPFVAPAVIRRLFKLLRDSDCCVPDVAGREHPLAAVYRVRVLETVHRHLMQCRLRMLDLLDDLVMRVVSEDEMFDVDPDLKTFCNLNTPADYEQALRDLRASEA